MASRIITLPNILTVIRMVLIPVFVTALYYQRFGWALAIFLLAGATDLLDGLLARHFDQGTPLGRILDPIADKLLLVTSFVVLSLPTVIKTEAIPPPHSHLPVPFWVTAAVISRDIFILVGSAAINIVTGFRKFRPSLLGKINTCVQIAAILIILTAARFPVLRGYMLPSTYTIVFAFALISGIHYIFWASKLLNDERDAKHNS